VSETEVGLKEYRVQFPVFPTRLPEYTNITVVNVVGNDLIIEFGFVDPYTFPPFQEAVKSNPEAFITATPITRVSISKDNAVRLLEQLQQNIAIIGGQS
jgi:hypothetical protein